MAKSSGKCIFCQRHGNMSKEHFWSDWMAQLFPSEALPAHHEFVSVKSRKIISVYENTLTRQGGAITKKLRVVCQTCNNGWMSRLEDDVKPFLTPLIRGEPIILDLEQQRTLAEWITLKMMVAEFNIPAEVVIPQIDRDALYLKRIIPSYFRIWAISSNSEKWRSRYIRHNATFSLPGTVPTFKTKRNTQTIAWGVGKIFIYVMMSTAPGLDLIDFINVHPLVPKLFPYTGGTLPLLFIRSIDDAAGDKMAATLDDLITSPKVIHFDLPK